MSAQAQAARRFPLRRKYRIRQCHARTLPRWQALGREVGLCKPAALTNLGSIPLCLRPSSKSSERAISALARFARVCPAISAIQLEGSWLGVLLQTHHTLSSLDAPTRCLQASPTPSFGKQLRTRSSAKQHNNRLLARVVHSSIAPATPLHTFTTRPSHYADSPKRSPLTLPLLRAPSAVRLVEWSPCNPCHRLPSPELPTSNHLHLSHLPTRAPCPTLACLPSPSCPRR